MRAIEISFPVDVEITGDQEFCLYALLTEICKDYVAKNPGRVMWVFGHGHKMLTNPFMADDEHPMEFDESVMQIEIAEREDYEIERIAAERG